MTGTLNHRRDVAKLWRLGQRYRPVCHRPDGAEASPICKGWASRHTKGGFRALIAHLNLANRHTRRIGVITLITLFTHFYLATIPYDGLRNEVSRGRSCLRSQKNPSRHRGKMIK